MSLKPCWLKWRKMFICQRNEICLNPSFCFKPQINDIMKAIVSPTINPPTEAIKKFDAMPGWTLIVAGDKKTPPDYKLERGIYLTPEMQEKYDRNLSDVTGWN